MTIAKAIARAWTDADYKAKLLGNPHSALADVGVDIPAGTNIKVTESAANDLHIVLPPAPEGDLSEADLEKVAGGTSTVCVYTGGY